MLSSLQPPPRPVVLEAGTTLFEQHEPGDAYYVLVRGRLAVFQDDGSGVARRVADVSVGEGVGEMALLSDEPRSATVRAVRRSELVGLDRSSFLDLVDRVPAVGLGVMQLLVQRLRTAMATTPVATRVSTVAVVGLDRHGGAARVADELADTLAGMTTCCLATPGPVPGSGRPLHDLEARYEVVVLAPDPNDARASEQTIDQADVVLLVADGAQSPTAGDRVPATAPDLGPWVRRELVLTWATDPPAPGAARRWCDAVTVDGVTHLRVGSAPDLVRLARRLRGEELGVVLSGGGARGFAHLGVLRALDEAGVAIGRIGGTSMGAMVGALRAAERTPDEQLALCRRIFVEGRFLRDRTYPEVALLRGRRLQDLTRTELGDVDIEDLPVPFFSVASSLTTAEVRVDERGSLWRAVRASGSVPGYGPPMYRDGESLVDGGVLANLPVEEMRARTTGPIIAVDVSREEYPVVGSDLDDATPSGWELRRRRRHGEAVPTLGRILYRVATLASAGAARRGRALADLVVAPPTARIGPLEFGRLEELAAIGYDAAREQLADAEGQLVGLRAAPAGRATREPLQPG